MAIAGLKQQIFQRRTSAETCVARIGVASRASLRGGAASQLDTQGLHLAGVESGSHSVICATLIRKNAFRGKTAFIDLELKA
jgi:hypothetical protein